MAPVAATLPLPRPRRARPGPVCGDPRLEGTAIPAIAGEGACGIADPVRLTAIAGVRLRPAATLRCDTAGRLAGWVDGPIQTAATDRLKAPVTELRVYASYVCRGRNNRPGAKLSEHAFGRAIDIGAFVLEDGRSIAVGANPEDTSERAFIDAARETACGPFGTVLGPGSDGHHADHLHLDTAERREPYCR